MNRKRAGARKACMPLFRADVKAVDLDGNMWKSNMCKETSSCIVRELHTF